MKISGIFSVAIPALLLLASCAEKVQMPDNDALTGDGIESKLIFTSENSVEGSLLVYFTDAAVSEIEGLSATRSAAVAGPLTRSGIAGIDNVLEDIGVKSLSRLFPLDTRNEARTRKAGLHRWYAVEFNEEENLDNAARALAALPEVMRVEFNRRHDRIVSSNPAMVSGTGTAKPATRSGSAVFNDPDLGLQWHYINTGDKNLYSGIKEGADVNCGAAWKLCTGDPRIIVAVVDDCVQWDHPDLAANMWCNEAELNGQPGVDDDGNGYVDDIYGYNFVTDGSLRLMSGLEASHGTHVAGTVAAVNNNGIGGCGIAGGNGSPESGVKIMSCQVFYGDNGGTASVIANAVKYAADMGAAIIQCSFGYGAGYPSSDEEYQSIASAEKDAIDYFTSTKNCDALDGGLAIFAAGNEMYRTSVYPGAYKDYISVTAMSCDYTPAYYTNYGPGCNIAAPGGDVYQSYLERGSEASQVYSTVNGGEYGYMQGTSMACPHVSGVAALGLSYALQLGRTFSHDEYVSLLLTSVNSIDGYCTGSKTYFDDYGYRRTLSLSPFAGKMGTGYIDAFQVLMNVRGTTCIPVPVGTQTGVDIKEYVGDGNAAFEIISAGFSDDDMKSLGIKEQPTIFADKILFTCGKTGSGILTVKLKAGTDGSSGISGMTIEKEFAIVARMSHSENGGWL